MVDELIDQISTLYQSSNPDFGDNEVLLSKFSEWQSKFYQEISEDIVTGQYLLIENYSTILDSIPEKLDGLISLLMANDLGDNLEEESSDYLSGGVNDYTSYTKSILSCLKRLKILLDQIENRNNLKNHKPLFILKNDDENWFIDTFANDINSILIPLEYHDHFLVVEETILNDLARIQSKIKESSFDENIKELVKIKCHFLIKKILRRLEEDDLYSFRYIDNFNDKDLQENLEPIIQCPHLDSLVKSNYEDDYDRTHRNKNKKNVPKILNEFQKNEHKLKFSEYQELSKFFKDVKEDRTSLENLLKSIEAIDTNSFDSRSIFAYNVSTQYIKNNILSFDREKNPNDLGKSYYEVCVHQEVYGLKNYFPHLYYAQYLRDEVSKKLNFDLIQVGELSEGLEHFERTLKEAYSSYKWCLDRDFQSFMCPTIECLYEISLNSGIKKNLFIGSSYVLPNNYNKVKYELDQLTQDLLKFKTLFDIYKKNLQLNEKIQNTENALNRAEKKNIEILSIFAAIVLFVTGEVQMFQFITEANQAIYFTLSFAYSLSLFSVLIWLITRDNTIKESWVSSRSIIVGVLICATITSFHYLSNTELPTQPKIEQYNKAIQKIDSLEKILKNQK